mgnify:FL=1
MSNDLGAGPATMGGQAARIPAQVTPEQGVALLQAQGGTLTAQISITRKATGKVEHYTLTASDQPKEP